MRNTFFLILVDSLHNHGIADLLKSGDVCARFKVITKTVFLSSPDAALFVAFPAQGAGNAFFLILVDSLRNHGAADLLESGDVCARFKVITKTVFLGSLDAASFCSIPRARRGEYFLFNFSRFPAQSWRCRPSRIRRCLRPLQGYNQDRISRQP